MGAIWEEDVWRGGAGRGGVYNCVLMGKGGCKLPWSVSVLRLIVTMLLVHIHSDISIAAVSPVWVCVVARQGPFQNWNVNFFKLLFVVQRMVLTEIVDIIVIPYDIWKVVISLDSVEDLGNLNYHINDLILVLS